MAKVGEGKETLGYEAEVAAESGVQEQRGSFQAPAAGGRDELESVRASPFFSAEHAPSQALFANIDGAALPCSRAPGTAEHCHVGFHDAAACQSFLDYYTQYTQSVCSLFTNVENQGEQSDLVAPSDSKRALVERWLKRPARVQVDPKELQEAAHCEGRDEYNIWYGRHLTDRCNRQSHLERDAAIYRCDPDRDAGYTAAGNSGAAFFCAFFAKGCCTKGSECLYKHVIPVREDEGSLDWSRDVFGRERHREHRDDMGGVGSFNHECKTLFVGGLKLDPLEKDGLKNLEDFLRDVFGVWGDVKAVRVIPKKLIGFVTYEYRVQAEFAKVAMADQNFGKYGGLLSVKWAHQDGNDDRRKLDSEERRKKPRVAEAACPQQQGVENVVVRQALESYCAAWQNYWGASSEAFIPGCTPQNECPPGSESEEEQNSRRLQGILSRVEGLSTADFLAACEKGSNIC